jgi:hypothetical protein
MHKNRLNINSSNSPTLESLLVLKQKAIDIVATRKIKHGNTIEKLMPLLRFCFKYTNHDFKYFL